MGFECRTQHIERSKFESADLIENRVAKHSTGELSGSAVALDALADIDMLAQCDMFVMLLRSCFARVAYALAISRRGKALPIISLEAPWSPSGKGALRKMHAPSPGGRALGQASRRAGRGRGRGMPLA